MSIFRFKEFQVKQEKSAAKVGTDGVLLGSWVPLNEQMKTVLDVGAGTGLISLILAQRLPQAQIHAVEKEEQAFLECTENFQHSPWRSRLLAFSCDFLQYKPAVLYDLILSNPPFYPTRNLTTQPRRSMARENHHLPLNDFFSHAKKRLSPQGKIALILPKDQTDECCSYASKQQLYPNQIVSVKGNAKAEVKRVLFLFSFANTQPIEKELTIEHARHQYTAAYKALTSAFYLHH